MNVPFYTTINILLCLSSLIPIIPKSSGLSKAKGRCSDEKQKLNRRTMTINISDSRGKRHNLPLVGVDNVDLHRIATCTKAPGRLVCKSGRYNYVINNGNFEFPAETLEKFVSALYQKAKDKESDFAVSLVAPDKESAPPVPLSFPTLPTFAKEVTESADHLQPVTIECELTDAKTLKETNPDYQPKPNEKVFRCITKRLGVKRKRTPLHVLMKQDQSVSIIGSSDHSLGEPLKEQIKRSPIPPYIWRIYEPLWEKTEGHILQTRSLPFSTRTLGDFVRKTGFASLFHKTDVENEGCEGEKDVAGYFHHELPRPRVRDFSHTCGDSEPRGWCPPLRSTTCLAHHCTYTSTLHPTFYTENPDEETGDEDRKLHKRLSYKFRNPLLEFILPYGLKGFARGEKHCTGCACTDSVTEHECKDNNAEAGREPLDSSKHLADENEELSIPKEEDYYDSEDSKCKFCNHRKPSDRQHCGKGHKCGHKQGCGSLEEYNSDCRTDKCETKESKKCDPMADGGGCRCCKCDIVCCCSCPPPKQKGPKTTAKPKHTTARRTTPKQTTRSTRCTVITQRICIGLQEEHGGSISTKDVLQSILESNIQLERPPTLK